MMPSVCTLAATAAGLVSSWPCELVSHTTAAVAAGVAAAATWRCTAVTFYSPATLYCSQNLIAAAAPLLWPTMMLSSAAFSSSLIKGTHTDSLARTGSACCNKAITRFRLDASQH